MTVTLICITTIHQFQYGCCHRSCSLFSWLVGKEIRQDLSAGLLEPSMDAHHPHPRLWYSHDLSCQDRRSCAHVGAVSSAIPNAGAGGSRATSQQYWCLRILSHRLLWEVSTVVFLNFHYFLFHGHIFCWEHINIRKILLGCPPPPPPHPRPPFILVQIWENINHEWPD